VRRSFREEGEEKSTGNCPGTKDVLSTEKASLINKVERTETEKL
jgi:hypothetical protein